MTENARSTHITHVGTVVIPVADQDLALEFYVGKLGFEKRLDAPFGERGRWIEVAPPGADTTIALVATGAGEPAGIEVSLATRDAEADHAELQAKGVEADAAVIRMDYVPPISLSVTRTATGSGWSSETDMTPPHIAVCEAIRALQQASPSEC